MDPIQPDFNQQPPAKLGLEIEMFGFDAHTLAPLGTRDAKVTPQQLMERIAARTGHLKTDSVTGEVVGLELSCGNFSLEPGGQLEYATCPHETIQGLHSDLKMGLELLEKAGNDQVLFLDHGTNPLADENLPLLVPKHRYRILDRYFRSQPGGRGVHMMRYSATAQPNIDVIGEENWHDAVRLTHALTPLAKELFANSCYFHGKKTRHSERQRIWNAIDPSRTGIPPQDYASWARKAYVFLAGDLPLEEQPLYGELTYEQWESQGYKGTRPDWVSHLGTLFPDLRLRRFLEVRMIDAQPFEHALAPMAFWATALHHARPQLWQLLKTNPSPAQLLRSVEQAAQDEESIQILRRYATRKQHFPDDPKEFVRIEATTRPSLKL